MTPEQRAAERFARENERKFRKESMFNLEDEED
jgi:nucleolar protein 14